MPCTGTHKFQVLTIPNISDAIHTVWEFRGKFWEGVQKKHHIVWFSGFSFFSDISEQNNDYSDTLDFRRERVGEVGVVTLFVLERSLITNPQC